MQIALCQNKKNDCLTNSSNEYTHKCNNKHSPWLGRSMHTVAESN